MDRHPTIYTPLFPGIPSIEEIRERIRPVVSPCVELASLPGKDAGLVYTVKGNGQEWVLKLEYRARHSVAKIHGFLTRHPEIPTTRVHACADAGDSSWRIILLEKCPGTPADQLLARVGAVDRERLVEALVDTLVQLQRVRFDRFGLFDEEGTVFRSFGSRREHLQAKQERALASHGSRIGADPAVVAIFRAAASAMSRLEEFPEQEPVLVHGDFNLPNVIVESMAPIRLRIVDWEWARAYEAAFDCCRFLIAYHNAEDLCRSFWRRYIQRTRTNPGIAACYLLIECFLHVDWALNQDRVPNAQVMHFARTFPDFAATEAWLLSLTAGVLQ